jgi:hypothetical protein
MSKDRKNYTNEERDAILAKIKGAVSDGQPVTTVLKAAGIPFGTYYGWLRERKPTPSTKHGAVKHKLKKYRKAATQHVRLEDFTPTPPAATRAFTTSDFFFVSGSPEQIAQFLASLKR